MRTMAIVALLPTLLSGPAHGAECGGLTAIQHAPLMQAPSVGARRAAFGLHLHPVLGIVKLHAGLDFEAPIGDPVMAAAAGKIVLAARKGEWGIRIEIDHGGGLSTSYSHLARMAPGVKDGACVTAGEVIGALGNTGLAAAPHLHFEVLRAGKAIDPATMLPR